MSQQINLFNPIFLKQKKVFAALTMAQALGMVLFGTLAVGLYGQQNMRELERRAAAGASQLEQAQRRQASVNTEFAPRHKDSNLERELAAAEARLRNLQQVAGVLASGQFGDTKGYSEYFRALARQRVDGLWLTGVVIGGAGHDIAVHGRALQPLLIPNYIGRLTREPVMRGKTFESLQIAQPTLAPAGGPTAPAPAQAARFVEFVLQSSGSPAPAQGGAR